MDRLQSISGTEFLGVNTMVGGKIVEGMKMLEGRKSFFSFLLVRNLSSGEEKL